MLTTCLNCHHSFKGNFCPNCGQKANLGRLTTGTLIKDILHFLTHIENGFLFTTWSFLARPGISSINYIAGKRKDYQKPVSYFLIWTGLFILLHNAIVNFCHYQLAKELIVQMDISEQSNLLFRQHFTLFIIPVILVSATLLYFIMGKPTYNFIEILTLSLYGAGTYFMMSLFSDIILGLLFKVNILIQGVFFWQGVLSSVYNFWFTYDLFKRLNERWFWLRLICLSLSVALSGWVIMLYLPMAWIYFTA